MSLPICLPPAPNWYSSSILDTGPGGEVAYGAKNHIVVIHPLDEDETTEKGSDCGNWRGEDSKSGEKRFPQVHVTYQAHGEKAKV